MKKEKKENVITKTKLHKMFGAYAVPVLLYAETIQGRARERGKVATFDVLKALPTKDDFGALKRSKSMTVVDHLISDAFSEFEALASELTSWMDNLPESLQGGDKYGMLDEAIGVLDNLLEPDYSDSLRQITAFHLPMLDTGSRPKRCAEAVRMLSSACEALETYADNLEDRFDPPLDEKEIDLVAECRDLINELKNAESEAEGVEFPGMY